MGTPGSRDGSTRHLESAISSIELVNGLEQMAYLAHDAQHRAYLTGQLQNARVCLLLANRDARPADATRSSRLAEAVSRFNTACARNPASRVSDIYHGQLPDQNSVRPETPSVPYLSEALNHLDALQGPRDLRPRHDGTTPDELLSRTRRKLKLALCFPRLHQAPYEDRLAAAIDHYNTLHERYRGSCHGYLLNATPTAFYALHSKIRTSASEKIVGMCSRLCIDYTFMLWIYENSLAKQVPRTPELRLLDAEVQRFQRFCQWIYAARHAASQLAQAATSGVNADNSALATALSAISLPGWSEYAPTDLQDLIERYRSSGDRAFHFPEFTYHPIQPDHEDRLLATLDPAIRNHILKQRLSPYEYYNLRAKDGHYPDLNFPPSGHAVEGITPQQHTEYFAKLPYESFMRNTLNDNQSNHGEGNVAGITESNQPSRARASSPPGLTLPQSRRDLQDAEELLRSLQRALECRTSDTPVVAPQQLLRLRRQLVLMQSQRDWRNNGRFSAAIDEYNRVCMKVYAGQQAGGRPYLLNLTIRKFDEVRNLARAAVKHSLLEKLSRIRSDFDTMMKAYRPVSNKYGGMEKLQIASMEAEMKNYGKYHDWVYKARRQVAWLSNTGYEDGGDESYARRAKLQSALETLAAEARTNPYCPVPPDLRLYIRTDPAGDRLVMVELPNGHFPARPPLVTQIDQLRAAGIPKSMRELERYCYFPSLLDMQAESNRYAQNVQALSLGHAQPNQE